MKFKHYILTRFNLGLYTTNPYKIKNPDKWMETRIKLFEKTAFPSIQKQTNKNFTWLMAFDKETPERFKRIYDYCDSIEICHEQPHQYLKLKDPENEFIITSRFDNDDIYEPMFVEEIQKVATVLINTGRTATLIIDIKYLKTNFKLTTPSGRKRANSPFLSLFEPWGEDINTALEYSHSTMPNYFSSIKIPMPLAKMVIHDNNIANKF